MTRAIPLLLALVILVGCGGGGGDSSSTSNATLLTLDAGAGTLTAAAGLRYELVLDDADEVAVAFSDRPVRQARRVPLRELVGDWDDNGWNSSPPAALLTVRDEAGGTWIEAFALSRPVLAGGAVRFTADSLDQVVDLPLAFLDADLFIQPPGTEVAGSRVFSLPANGGTFTAAATRTWTLTLDEVSPIAAYLWTGTPAEGGPIDTAAFIPDWASYGFDAVPPNASVTVRNGGDTAVAVVTLSDPSYDPEAATLRFTATDVDGSADLPSHFVESDLFIDSAGGGGPKSTAFTKLIGIDYDPEARCSDDNWSTTTPAACNPQPSFSCGGDGLAFCPTRCQACFDTDLTSIKDLGFGAITLYNPNYYALKSAQARGVKVLLGTFNDTLAGLAQPDATSGCTYSSFPTACGATYANYLIDGACGTHSPWDPLQFCGDNQTFIAPWKPSLDDGTVIGIQIGNEVLVNGYTMQQVLAAAQTLRGVLDARGYTADKVPVVISLVLGEENSFCANGAPPANVDFVAAHPYCTNIAGTPPMWPASGTACLEQVQRDFVNLSQQACGAANVFIGETGFNAGCPQVHGTSYFADATAFTSGATQWACENSYGLFHFAFVDACPLGGCLAGCPDQPREGNGYFGLYYTENYLTKGALVPKLSPMPSFVCP